MPKLLLRHQAEPSKEFAQDDTPICLEEPLASSECLPGQENTSALWASFEA